MTSRFSAEEARQLRVRYQAWLGLPCLEDGAAWIARQTGCREAEAWDVYEGTRRALITRYAAGVGLSDDEAEAELEGADTLGSVRAALPAPTGWRQRWEGGRYE